MYSSWLAVNSGCCSICLGWESSQPCISILKQFSPWAWSMVETLLWTLIFLFRRLTWLFEASWDVLLELMREGLLLLSSCSCSLFWSQSGVLALVGLPVHWFPEPHILLTFSALYILAFRAVSYLYTCLCIELIWLLLNLPSFYKLSMFGLKVQCCCFSYSCLA